MVMPAGNLIGGNLVTPDQPSVLTAAEIAPNLIPGGKSIPVLINQLNGVGGLSPWSLVATRQNSMCNAGTRGGGVEADKGRLIRVSHVACAGITVVRFKYTNVYNGTNGETPNTNPIAFIAGVEYPLGTVYKLTFGGKQVATVDGGATIISDPVAISIPAGATFYERNVVVASNPPGAPSATPGSGGALAANTYYYKLTAVTDLGESGGSTEVSATVGASGTVALAWTDLNVLVPTRYFKLYRATSSNAEVFVTTIPAGSTSYTDAGAITPGAATVPGQQFVPLGIQLSTTLNNEGQIFNSPSPFVQMTAASPGFGTANSTCFSACAIYGVADATLKPGVALVGDSIISGTGDTGYNGRLAGDSGFAVRVLDAALIPHISLSQGSETLANFQTTQRQNRLPRLIGAKYVISNYGTNSLASQTVAQMKAAILEIAGAIIGCGAFLYWCTLNPKTTSTDNWTTAANQTPLNTTDAVDATYNSIELRRAAINAWLRDNSASGFVAQAGGAGVAGLFDTASKVEVNSSNALTLTGGRYICAAAQDVAQYSTTDGTHPSTQGHILMSAGIDTANLA